MQLSLTPRLKPNYCLDNVSDHECVQNTFLLPLNGLGYRDRGTWLPGKFESKHFVSIIETNIKTTRVCVSLEIFVLVTLLLDIQLDIPTMCRLTCMGYTSALRTLLKSLPSFFIQQLNFVRFYLPLLIHEHEKVIYLDDDVIVQGKGLSPLI